MLQKFNNLRKIIFGTNPNTADNAVARVADVNNLIDAINSQQLFVSRLAAITQNGPGVPPTVQQPVYFATAPGPVVVDRPCQCMCNFPPSPLNNLAQYNGKCRAFCCHTYNYVAPGQIGLTIPLGAPYAIGVFVQNMANYGESVNVARLANDGEDAKFLIKVYDIAGLPSDTLLQNAMINTVMFYSEPVI